MRMSCLQPDHAGDVYTAQGLLAFRDKPTSPIDQPRGLVAVFQGSGPFLQFSTPPE